MWLLAELTYSCPLQCPYCSNPIDYKTRRKNQLETNTWKRVFDQGRELGAVQLGLSGGEPCVRNDLEELIQHGRSLGYYTNLITSTVGMDKKRLDSFVDAGIDHIQISFQGTTAKTSNFFAGTDCWEHKITMAHAVTERKIPLVANFVLHKHNLHQVKDMLDLAVSVGAEAVELANCQFHGWAMKNIADLLPTKEQVLDAEAIVKKFREDHGEKMPIFFVVPDFLEQQPRACLNGWGTTMISVAPDGRVLPCQGAQDFPNIDLPNAQTQSLIDIWHHSPMFNLFRGDSWMKEPCRSCDQKDKDFGGCRCQAFLLTGDPSNTDPVCPKSPHNHLVKEILAKKATGMITQRSPNEKIIPIHNIGSLS